jgi:hypothetical protein
MGKYSFSDFQDQRRENRRPKPEKKVYKIKPRSIKGAKEDRVYSELSKKFKEQNPFCKAKLPGCTIYTTDVHHKALRGKNYLNIETWLPVCRNCHKYIHEHPKESFEKGFLISKFM